VTDYIAPYITKAEYACHHCGKLPYSYDTSAHFELFDRFGIIRGNWGKPIVINSGFRCGEYNRDIGGSPLSAHLFGLAFDLPCVDAKEVDRLYDLINRLFPDLRIGIYKTNKTFIHIDVAFMIYPLIKESWVQGTRWYE